MSIRKRDVHFSDWTKVRHALVCNNIQGITETSSFDEVRTFLINSESGSNPFYYYVCYIKETKEIYTHGQFYDCSKYDDSAILQKIEELESTLDTKVDLTVFEELQSEVKENELVTTRALTELNEKKADLFDFNAIKAEIEENEKVAAKAFMDLNERKLDKEDLNNIDLSNYVDWDTYYNNLNTTNSAINLKANQNDLDTLSAKVDLKANQTDLETLSESLNTLSSEVEENEDVTAAALTKLHEDKADKSDLENLSVIVDDAMASSLLKTEQVLTDDEKAQVRTNIGAASADYMISISSNLATVKDIIDTSISEITTQYALGDSKELISTVSEWVQQNALLTNRMRSCVYANGYYVICGTSGEISYSLDSINWVEVPAFTSDVIVSACYGYGKFVVVTSAGEIWESYNTPTNWVKIDQSFDYILENIQFVNNRFYIVGASGLYAYSAAAYKWEWDIINDVDLYKMTYGNGVYVAVGLNGSILKSTDGATWENVSNSSITASLRTVAFGGGKFIAGGQGGIILYSNDGVTWNTATNNTTLTISYIRDIGYAEGRYFAVMYASDGTGEIWVSQDGITWTVQYSAPGRLWCLSANHDILITSGDNGSVYTLDLGIEWLDKEPNLAEDDFLWQRTVIRYTSGAITKSESVFVSHADVGRVTALEAKTNLSDFTDDLVRGYKKIDHGTSDTTFALTPNVYHIWGEVTSLSLTYGSHIDGFANEYLFQFTSGSTATTLSLPDTVKWANDNVISIESGKTYSISIVNNLALFASFTN